MHVDAMLRRADSQVCPASCVTLVQSRRRLDAAAGRGARHDQDARAFYRGDRRNDRSASIFADQHRHAPETRLERAEMAAAR